MAMPVLPSYASGTSTVPLLGDTIGANLDRSVAEDAVAVGLLDLGVTKGDRVGIWAPNRPEWTMAQYATARISLSFASGRKRSR